jgi:hypothetical protein
MSLVTKSPLTSSPKITVKLESQKAIDDIASSELVRERNIQEFNTLLQKDRSDMPIKQNSLSV